MVRAEDCSDGPKGCLRSGQRRGALDVNMTQLTHGDILGMEICC